MLLLVLGREVDRVDERENARLLRQIYLEIQPYVWGLGLFLLVVIAGAGTTVFSQGLLVAGVGLSIWMVPPAYRVSGPFVIWMVALALYALHAWIPAEIVPLSEWKEIYLSDPSSSILPILGPNFGAYAVSWILFMSGLTWLYWVLSFKIRSESVHAVLWLMALSISILSIGVMVGNSLDLRLPYADDPSTFTYFPNRNQTSIVLAVGACIALCMTLYNAVHMRLIAFGLGGCISIVTLGGLLQMESRGGVLFLFAGLLVFTLLASLMMRKASALPWLKLGLPCVILVLSLFTLLDVGVRDRLIPMVRGDFSSLADEFRYAVWADTLQLVGSEPLGVGLGHFAAVIPQYLDQAVVGKAILHPESSWLWLLSELGWVGFFIVVILTGLMLFKAILGLNRFPNPIRLLALIALAILFAHSLVDVGWHRPGVWVLGVLLLGIVFRQQTGVKLRENSSAMLGNLKIWSGALILIGLLWMVAAFFPLPVHSASIAERSEGRVREAVSNGDSEAVLEATDTWLLVEPLNWEPHFLRARGYLTAGGEDETLAVNSFRKARFLNPHLASLGMMEGDTWLARENIGRAFNAWNWMLSRKSENEQELLNQLFQRAWNKENARDQLILLSETQPSLRLRVYEEVELDTFIKMVEADLEAEELGLPFWNLMPAEFRLRWTGVVGWKGFEAFVQKNPSFASLLTQWPIKFEGLIGDGEFEAAALHFLSNTSLPGIPGNIEAEELISLERQYRNTPDDYYRGLLVAKKQIELGNDLGALEVLQTMIKRRQGTLPDLIYYWEGELLNRSGDLEGAVKAWSRWILESQLME
ncbi:MAG: O-antigen ligase family protein [Verrucomicrobiota bacterium]